MSEQPDLRTWRKERGLMAKQVAEMLGVTPEHISKCESGRHAALSAKSWKLLRYIDLGSELLKINEELLGEMEMIRYSVSEAAYACSKCQPSCGPVKACNEVYEIVDAMLKKHKGTGIIDPEAE